MMGWFSALMGRRTLGAWAGVSIVGVLAMATIAFVGMASAQSTTCTTANVLAGSDFEIDTSANLKVDGAAPCIDWLADGTRSALRSGVLTKNDKLSGTTDDSFGQGTSENDANPTIVDGSIPPNKSDLKTFGVYTETGSSAKVLELFWTRINSPQGTTNMDFELNQKFCDPSATPTNCADNKHQPPETPIRTTGDKLITYDLSNGGTVPTISIRTWNGTAWGPASVISGGANAQALASVNTSSIAANDSGGLGTLDPFTFGEAAINFNALFSGNQCGKFGSAYLKSRSSDSFQAELKDFIGPRQVNISNCTSLVTNATPEVTIGSPIHDTATLSGAAANAGGTITFKTYSDASCSTLVFTSGPVTVNGNGNYTSTPDFTPTAVGTYYWTASYSGDLNNAKSETTCGDANESSVVNKAKPSLVTNATPEVTIGSPIHDTATLSGAAANAGGTITFKAYSDASCSTLVFTSGPVTVNGNGNYTSTPDFTPTKAGTYYWTASYGGDLNNKSASTACGDANESSVVNKAPSNISTAQTLRPQDSVTLSASAGGTPTGSVTFELFGPNDPTCSGAALYTETVPLTNGTATTSNTSFSVSSAAADTYRWKVVYGGDATHNGATSACGTEQFTLTIQNS